jgi:hypothetical protein
MREASIKDSQGHGGRIPPVQRDDYTDDTTLPWPTRLRLMIEELWDDLSQANPHHEAARQALAPLHQHARQEEENDLAKTGIPGTTSSSDPSTPSTRPQPRT